MLLFLPFVPISQMPTQSGLIAISDIAHIPGTDLLGPYPILQFFAALIVLVMTAIGGFVWLKGQKLNQPLSAPKTPEAATQLFFDGPLKAIFDYLQEIRSKVISNKLELKDEFAAMLSQHRIAITSEISAAQHNQERSMDDVKGELAEIRDLLVRMDERDKNYKK